MLKLLRKLLSLFSRRERRQLLGLLGILLVGTGLEMLGVGLIFPFISLLQTPEAVPQQPILGDIYQVLGSPPPNRFLLWGGIGLIALYALKNAFLAGMYYLQFSFLAKKRRAISSRLLQRYLYAPYTFHLQRNTAQLLRNLTDEVGQLFNNVMTPLMQLATSMAIAAGIALVLIAIEPLASLVAVGIMGIATTAFYRLFRNNLARLGKQRQYHNGQAIQHIHQGLGGVKETKVLRREEFFRNRYDEHLDNFVNALRLQQTINQMPRLFLETLVAIGLLAVVLVLLAQQKGLEAVLPTLSLFAVAAFRLMPAVNKIVTQMNQIRFGSHALDVVHHELAVLAPEQSGSERAGDSRVVPALKEKIALRDVAYRYPNVEEEALKGVSLSIPQGTSAGFVGASGAGKTTIVDVILGLLAPAQGEVLVDGVDIHQNLESWQSQIGYIPQNIYLCDDTLRGNIAFGIPEGQVDEGRVWSALKSAQLEALVEQLPQELETVVGERGVRFSGGQRQRVGIARALYHNPQVLVMDEATAALDNETEAGVMAAVEQLSGEKTLIIIAHRFNTIENCDQLFYLEGGKLENENLSAESSINNKRASQTAQGST